jgi:hypothetical protein
MTFVHNSFLVRFKTDLVTFTSGHYTSENAQRNSYFISLVDAGTGVDLLPSPKAFLTGATCVPRQSGDLNGLRVK